MNHIDIHCHLNSPEFDADRDQVIARMCEQGIRAIVIGTNETDSRQAVALAEQYENIYAIIGLHPNEIEGIMDPFVSPRIGEMSAPGGQRGREEGLLWIEELIQHPCVIGIGECGLDYFRNNKDSEILAVQEKVFRYQIELSLKYNKPLMLHNRPSKGTYDTYEDTLRVLSEYKKEGGEKLRGDVHFFAGSVEIMKRFVELGFYISFTGVITFTNDYDDVIRAVPDDRILAETDAPYVAPIPYRGNRCEPRYVIETYKKLAKIREVDEEKMREQILENAKNLFFT